MRAVYMHVCILMYAHIYAYVFTHAHIFICILVYVYTTCACRYNYMYMRLLVYNVCVLLTGCDLPGVAGFDPPFRTVQFCVSRPTL